MDFGLSQEQELLQQTIRRYIEESLPTPRVREIMQSDSGHDAGVYGELAELGVLGVLVPEALGGSGLGLFDAALAAQILGWGAAPVPFLGATMAVVALRSGGTPEQSREWLPRIASGASPFGVAATETYDARDDAGVRVAGGRLSGNSLVVLEAGAADFFLVAVGSDSIAIVPRTASGLTVEAMKTVDLTRRIGELKLEGVEPADWIGGPGRAGKAVTSMLDAGRALLAADTLGSCDRALQLTVEYAGERRQFGRVIGSFQAVKHLCAEMVAQLEPARSLVWYAAYALDELPDEGPKAVALAKSHLSEVGTFVLRTATEVHGGIGFTEECDLNLWYKRVELNRQLLGGPALLRERAASLQGWESV